MQIQQGWQSEMDLNMLRIEMMILEKIYMEFARSKGNIFN